MNKTIALSKLNPGQEFTDVYGVAQFRLLRQIPHPRKKRQRLVECSCLASRYSRPGSTAAAAGQTYYLPLSQPVIAIK